jgi:hypothetical protein
MVFQETEMKGLLLAVAGAMFALGLAMVPGCDSGGGDNGGDLQCTTQSACAAGTAACCDNGIAGTWDPTAAPPLRCTCPTALPTSPTIPQSECTIDLGQWGIYADGTHAAETTDGINAAIVSAVGGGCGRVQLPAGTYLIGKPLDSATTDGLHLLSNMALVLDPAAVLQMVTNNTPFYNLLDLRNVQNVEITGGSIRGDRLTHVFDDPGQPGNDTHEFGYLVYIREATGLVFVHDSELSQATGDGVTIEPIGAGASCADITVTHCNIHDNRRQGISVVGGTRVLIENNEIHHINGTAPQFAIDIESENHISRDVTIRSNSFHDNTGGDFVKCDGRNILFEQNTCTQGDLQKQTDGPVVLWRKGDATIRNNTITMTVPTANGMLGIVEYALSKKGTAMPIVLDGNVLNECGISNDADEHVVVVNNQVHDHFIAMSNIQDLWLVANSIDATGGCDTFMFNTVTGSASSNTRNGAPVDIPLDSNKPYSNAPSCW